MKISFNDAWDFLKYGNGFHCFIFNENMENAFKVPSYWIFWEVMFYISVLVQSQTLWSTASTNNNFYFDHSAS